MLRGLYSSASGMIADTRRLEVLANNLANASTSGYKRDTVLSHPFGDLLVWRLRDPDSNADVPRVGPLGLGAYPIDTATRLQDGTLVHTDRILDVAVMGNGLFSIQTPAGVRYTRNGSFTQDAEGRLVTQDGHSVLVNGEPVGRPGTVLTLSDQGEVFVDGGSAGKLSIVTPTDTGPLRKVGASLWTTDASEGQLVSGLPPEPEARTRFQIRVGYLESSNVEPVIEMVALIATMRSFEANQKAMQAQEVTLERAVNEVGRP